MTQSRRWILGHGALVAVVALGGLASASGAGADALTTTSSFSPASIALGGASSLTIRETATADGDGPVHSAEAYAPFGIALRPGSTSVCGGTVTVSADSSWQAPFALGPGEDIELSGVSVTPDDPCTFTLPVTGEAAGTTPLIDQYDPDIQVWVPSTTGLTVAPSQPAPQVAISLSPATIPEGGTTTETISLSNPADAPMSYLSTIAANDLLATTFSLVSNTCGGVALTTGDNPDGAAVQYDYQLRMAEASLPAGGSCRLIATVAPNQFTNTPGTYPMYATAASREGGQTRTSVPLTITPAPPSTTSPSPPPAGPSPTGRAPSPALRATLRLTPASLTVGRRTTATVRLTDAGSAPAADISFSRSLPRGVTVARSPRRVHACGGRVATAGSRRLSLRGGTLRAGRRCTIAFSLVAGRRGRFRISSGEIHAGASAMHTPVSALLRVRARTR